MAGRTTLISGLAALLCGGCGTLDNIQRPTRPPAEAPDAPVCRVYGGVRGEWAVISTIPKSAMLSPVDYVVVPLLALGDLVFTLAGDTVTLPYTLVAEGRRLYNNSPAPPAQASASSVPLSALPPAPPQSVQPPSAAPAQPRIGTR